MECYRNNDCIKDHHAMHVEIMYHQLCICELSFLQQSVFPDSSILSLMYRDCRRTNVELFWRNDFRLLSLLRVLADLWQENHAR